MEQRVTKSLSAFFALYKTISYKKREVILRAEDIPQGVYFIKKGFVRLYAISKEGEELTLLIFKQYDFFPVHWAITSLPIYYNYESLTPVEISRAPRDTFVTYLKTNPDVLFHIAGSVLVRLNNTFERMKYLVYGNAYAKVASILTISARGYGAVHEKGILIEVPLTHQDLANLIGLTRETVSVEMSRLEKKGIVLDLGKYLCITDLNLLKKEAKWSKED